MFIRPCYRKKDGKRHAYWALVESYRSERGPRQRVVAYLGRFDEAGRLGVREAALERSGQQQKTLFPEPEPEWVEVDASAVRVENCRQFGGPWLALELIKTLGLDTFLRETIPSGREEVPWSVTALVLPPLREDSHTTQQTRPPRPVPRWKPPRSFSRMVGSLIKRDFTH